MDYFKLVNTFWRRQLLNPVSSKAVSLYLAIVECANWAGWPEAITAPLGTLTAMTQLSKSQLYLARKELVEAGLISIRAGQVDQAAAYSLTFPK